ncbi:uncharacterized protein Z518_03485 [Rhinocladiella mackenziei CBS 650.93]|uniref:Rhinocladiella mackenziei CBS 650.93 unplaced genomic scaffold supercont1.2, whole genome shotgun sequence n=1 Tax=Rhinocladiella mackenziei CBS 650.93 TaxID=1442369 RepID=A0A0D2HE36_9EURO|nr:uncharacterized protein Z518_03485 [Rhinocladiella mackenziei CBS 650.93]KIX08828.1 hypothetical protein Z518_03485 [Rhinocladiella mackenziei CBS 650.93]
MIQTLRDQSITPEPSDRERLHAILLESVDTVRSTGSFAITAVAEAFPPPELRIEGVGAVRVPLSLEDVQSFLRVCDKAPFGKGQHTLYDESIRKTLQIDGSRINFGNDAWFRWLKDVTASVAEGLGVACGAENVHAELYKMLVYGEGAMFKPHRDTEKASGMFGTLVICLPSEHVGGAVHLQHGQEHMKFETDKTSKHSVAYGAWYADVSHEVEPVVSGYRIVLAYNLVTTASLNMPTAAAVEDPKMRLMGGLDLWCNLKPNGPQGLCYALEHKYTKDGLSISRLKGCDYLRTKFVADVCDRHGRFHVLLALLHKVVTRPNCDEGKDMESVSTQLGPIKTLEGFKLQTSRSLTISESIIVKSPYYPANLWGDLDEEGEETEARQRRPDALVGEEYLGNQPGDLDKIYTDAVILIVDKDYLTDFLLPRSSNRAADYEKMLRRLRDQFEENRRDPIAQSLILQISQQYLERSSSSSQEKDDCLGTTAAAAIHIAEHDLWKRAVAALENGFNRDSFYDLGRLFASGTAKIKLDELSEGFSKIPTLRDTWWALEAFTDAFWDADSSYGPEEMSDAGVSLFVKQRVIDALDSLKALPQDAATVIFVGHEYGEEFFDQRVKPFILRFLHDTDFVNAITLEALFCSRASDEHVPAHCWLASDKYGPTISRILQLTLDVACSDFTLGKYLSRVKCSALDDKSFPFSCRPQHFFCSGKAERDADVVADFYKRARDIDTYKGYLLLDKIQASAADIPITEMDRLLIPLLQKLFIHTDADSEHVRHFYQSTLITYLVRTVEYEPEKPLNWDRANELDRCYLSSCPDCDALRSFMAAPDLEKVTIKFSGPYNHGSLMIQRWCETKEERNGALTITKTTKRWEVDKQQWEERAERARRILHRFPEEELRKRLGTKYGSVMNLDVIKLSSKRAHSALGEEPRSVLNSKQLKIEATT